MLGMSNFKGQSPEKLQYSRLWLPNHILRIPELLLTLIGWVFVAKALLRFALPSFVQKRYRNMGSERAWQIQVAGVFFVALAGLFTWIAYQHTRAVQQRS
jgi:hypothetical protein